MQHLLYGLHDPGGEHLLKPGCTIVFTEGIGHNPDDLSGGDYRRWAQQGLDVIVRLNNGYGHDGTIPLPEYYADFAIRCANFVRNSPGCTKWIIGNEPNHAQERPQGQVITAHDYAACFVHVAKRIFEDCGEQHHAIAAAVAPWNDQSGDWLAYQRTMLADLQGYADGISLHTYTHGTDPALVTSLAKMGPPYEGRYWHFLAYRDLMAAIPDALRDLPVYITETDQGDVPWADTNSGWVQRAYDEINWWNQQPGHQRIMCMALYRWPDLDQWGIINKPGVHDDLRAAVAKGYVAPAVAAPPQPAPPVNAPAPSQPLPPIANPVVWDPQLDARGVKLVPLQTSTLPAGSTYYRVVRAEFLDEAEAQGKHVIGVDVLDSNGVRIVGAPVRQYWADDDAVKPTEAKAGEPWAVDFPMTAAGYGYGVTMDGVPADKVEGMGLGDIARPTMGIHVCYTIVFQQATVPAKPTTVHIPIVSNGGQPTPAPVPAPAPAQPAPTALVHPLPVGVYRITQRFNETTTNPKGHEGTDFGALGGTPIFSIADGIVAFAGSDKDYGNYVRVAHKSRGMESFFAHLSRIDVQIGQAVVGGQILGAVGSTGNSTGNHLHLEIRLGEYGAYSPAAPKEMGRCDPETWCAMFGLSLSQGVSSNPFLSLASG